MVTEGSPGSRVEKLDLSKWEFTAMQDFKNFSIRFWSVPRTAWDDENEFPNMPSIFSL